MTENDKEYVVLFDTNSYRQFVMGKSTEKVLEEINELKEFEKKKNITSCGIMVVALEMLGNLAEGENGFNYKDCLNGLLAMTTHCLDEEKNAPRFTPQPYLHIARSFFNTVPTDMENKVQNLIGVANDLRIDLDKALKTHTEKDTFNQVKAFIEREENQFARQITDLIEGARQEIIRKHPKIANKQLRAKLLDYIENGPFEPFVALAIIYAVAANLQLQLPQDEGVKRAFTMHLEFPLSVGFFKWISHKIVFDNIDMQSKTSKEKRWNWHWDYQVSFLVNGHTLANKEVILVTSDGDVIDMLKDFGYENKVFTITDYLNYLKQS